MCAGRAVARASARPESRCSRRLAARLSVSDQRQQNVSKWIVSCNYAAVAPGERAKTSGAEPKRSLKAAASFSYRTRAAGVSAVGCERAINVSACGARTSRPTIACLRRTPARDCREPECQPFWARWQYLRTKTIAAETSWRACRLFLPLCPCPACAARPTPCYITHNLQRSFLCMQAACN